jgi:hypothetical protein
MEEYTIIITDEAADDILRFYNHICYKYKAPFTAARNRMALYKTIGKLSCLANTKSFNPYVQSMFGNNARHITYKRMAIIYEIRSNCVFVKRVITGALIH